MYAGIGNAKTDRLIYARRLFRALRFSFCRVSHSQSHSWRYIAATVLMQSWLPGQTGNDFFMVCSKVW